MKLKSLSVVSNRMFMYRFFKKFPQYAHLNTGKTRDVSAVIKTFHEELIDTVINFRYGVELPLKSGKIMVVSYKASNYPNFAVYNKHKTAAEFTNNHTDGLNCKIFYTNRQARYRVKDRYIWEFIPERPFKKKVSQAFAKDYNKYIFSPGRQIGFYNHLDAKIKQADENKIEKFLVTYDEFNMN